MGDGKWMNMDGKWKDCPQEDCGVEEVCAGIPCRGSERYGLVLFVEWRR
jgi:hypothetical protein